MSFPKGSLLSVLAGRVLENLEFIDAAAPHWNPESPESDNPPFADTQLLISLLGILIFPHERTPNALGELLDGYEAPLNDIIRVRYSAEGGGRVSLDGGNGPAEIIDTRSLKELPRLLRNSIAHFNIRPLDLDGRFGGIRIWNRNKRGDITFVADLNFDAFRPLARHILHSLHDREGLALDDTLDPLDELRKEGRLDTLSAQRSPDDYAQSQLRDCDLSELSERTAQRLAQLLIDDEAGWYDAARWLDKRALEEGLDLFANYDDPTLWARSTVEALGYPRGRFPDRPLECFETAEELFWALMPHP